MKGATLALTLAASALAASFAPAVGQPQAAPQAKAKGPQFAWPERMKNAQVLPADTTPDQLRDTMRGFAMSLGVRCTFCHVGPEGAPLSQLDFASDANPHKDVARAMLRMVGQLNRETLPAIANLSEPRVTCYTCHRGAAEPATIPPEPTQAPAAAPPQPAAQPQPPQGERGAS